MNVLSLFDGISCGHVALDRAGIKADRYYASEIDKNAIKVTQTNYPDTIQLGDIRLIDEKDLPAADRRQPLYQLFIFRQGKWYDHQR